MADEPPFTEWTSVPGSRSGALRLAAVGGGIVLYRAATAAVSPEIAHTTGFDCQTVLSPTAVGGSPGTVPEIAIPQILPTSPDFDIVALDGGAAVATEWFGGALNALQVGTASGGGFSVRDSYAGIIDYQHPRFLRGGGISPGRFVSAIVYESRLVAIDKTVKDPKTGGPYVALTGPDDRVVDGVILCAGTTQTNGILPSLGSLELLYRLDGDGVAPSPAGDFAGTLFIRSAAGSDKNPPQMLLESNGTYAFDADEQDGTLLIVAATTKGPQLLAYDLAAAAAKPIAWPPGYPSSGTWIASPTVLAVAGAPGQKLVSFAFYEGTGSAVSGVRYGQVDLAQVR